MRIKVPTAIFWLLMTIASGTPLWLHAAEAQDTLLYSATYEGRFSGLNITLDRTLTQRKDGTFQLLSEASNWFASIRETSEFHFKEDTLLPISYEFRRRVFGRRVVESINYDWDSQQAFYERSDRARNNTTHKLNGQILDPALFQLMLPIDFFGGEESVTYEFIKRRRIDSYSFDLKGDDTVNLGGKQYQAVLVARLADDRQTRVWLVPSMDHQIGRIEHRDEDDTYDIRLTQYQSNSAQLKDFYRKAQAQRSVQVDIPSPDTTNQKEAAEASAPSD